MGDSRHSTPGDRDDAPSNAPLEHGGFTPRRVNNALADLNTEFDHLTKPPAFRLAEMLQLAVIAIGIIVAIFTAMGLQGRMDDIRTRQSDAERRIETRISEAEQRLDRRLEAIDDELGRIPKAPLDGTN